MSALRTSTPAGISQNLSFLASSPATVGEHRVWLGTKVVGLWQVPNLRLQASLSIKGVKMKLAVGKAEEYVGDSGRAGEGRDKQ